MEATTLTRLQEFFAEEVTTTELAQVLRKTDFELINLVLNAQPDFVDRELIISSHFFLIKLADILEAKDK